VWLADLESPGSGTQKKSMSEFWEPTDSPFPATTGVPAFLKKSPVSVDKLLLTSLRLQSHGRRPVETFISLKAALSLVKISSSTLLVWTLSSTTLANGESSEGPNYSTVSLCFANRVLHWCHFQNRQMRLVSPTKYDGSTPYVVLFVHSQTDDRIRCAGHVSAMRRSTVCIL
jgi:hypothetical protein